MRMVWSSFYDYTVKLLRFAQSFRCSDPQLSARQEIPSHHDTKVSDLKSPSFVIFVRCVLNCPVPNLAF
jgi:hypothetical protein